MAEADKSLSCRYATDGLSLTELFDALPSECDLEVGQDVALDGNLLLSPQAALYEAESRRREFVWPASLVQSLF